MTYRRPHDERLPYLQIVDDLRRAIMTGSVGPGDKLPSNAELKETYRVAGQTAQNAINALKSEGLVYGVAGRGVFVRSDLDMEALRASADPVDPAIPSRVLDHVLAELSSLTVRFDQMEERLARLEEANNGSATTPSGP